MTNTNDGGRPAPRKLAMPQIGDQVFASEDGEEFGAIRAVQPNGKSELVVYVENSGEFSVPLGAISAVHDGKVILHAPSLSPAMQVAIRHAHTSED